MANICSNQLHIACSPIDREYIDSYLKKTFNAECTSDDTDSEMVYLEYEFDSRWVFPEEPLTEMVNNLKEPDCFDASCLSIEWGNLYCAFHTFEGEGWSLE